MSEVDLVGGIRAGSSVTVKRPLGRIVGLGGAVQGGGGASMSKPAGRIVPLSGAVSGAASASQTPAEPPKPQTESSAKVTRREALERIRERLKQQHGDNIPGFRVRLRPANLPKEKQDTYCPPIVRVGRRMGRNDPCYCGSKKKYKRCCIDKDRLLGLG